MNAKITEYRSRNVIVVDKFVARYEEKPTLNLQVKKSKKRA